MTVVDMLQNRLLSESKFYNFTILQYERKDS